MWHESERMELTVSAYEEEIERLEKELEESYDRENTMRDEIKRLHKVCADFRAEIEQSKENANYRIGKQIKSKKCHSCSTKECLINCNDSFNRCPVCNEVLDDDHFSEPKYCPYCGQALIWYTEEGIPLRGY